MKRVRYRKDENGGYETDFIQTTHNLVVAKIKGLEWSIENHMGEVMRNGTGKSSPDIKKQIKKHLIDMGTNFLDEVRNTKGGTK